MYPKTQITIKPDGSSKIEGLEQSDNCSKLSELGQVAGKVISDEDKEHQPVHQDVNRKGN